MSTKRIRKMMTQTVNCIVRSLRQLLLRNLRRESDQRVMRGPVLERGSNVPVVEKKNTKIDQEVGTMTENIDPAVGIASTDLEIGSEVIAIERVEMVNTGTARLVKKVASKIDQPVGKRNANTDQAVGIRKGKINPGLAVEIKIENTAAEIEVRRGIDQNHVTESETAVDLEIEGVLTAADLKSLSQAGDLPPNHPDIRVPNLIDAQVDTTLANQSQIHQLMTNTQSDQKGSKKVTVSLISLAVSKVHLVLTRGSRLVTSQSHPLVSPRPVRNRHLANTKQHLSLHLLVLIAQIVMRIAASNMYSR